MVISTNSDMKRFDFKKRALKKQAGQTIVEILVATAVVALVLTAVASGLTYSIKSASESKYRSVATSKAQEAVEVFRYQRSTLGWETFVEVLATGGAYCYNTLPTPEQFLSIGNSICDTGVADSGTEFKRDVLVTVAGDENSVTVESTVSWTDGTILRDVVVTQQLFNTN